MNLCIILWTWMSYFYINSGKTDMFIIHSFYPRIMCIFFVYSDLLLSLSREFLGFFNRFCLFSITWIVFLKDGHNMELVAMICFASLLPPVCSPLELSLLCTIFPYIWLPISWASHCSSCYLLVLAQKENIFHGGEAELVLVVFPWASASYIRMKLFPCGSFSYLFKDAEGIRNCFN